MTRWAAAAASVVAAAALVSCVDDGPSRGRSLFAALGGPAACPPIEGYPFPVADHGSADLSAAAVIEIDAGDSFFAPTCALNVPVGTVTLRVTNSGSMNHSVVIADQGIDIDILAGETIDVEVDIDDGGLPLVYFCKYHRTAGMVGALVTAP